MDALSRREFLANVVRGGTAAALAGTLLPHALLGAEPTSGPTGKYNVLFIAVDDLRPELGCYGAIGMKTPNIDALAAQGTVFNRAYCQQAVCSPSRTSLLIGLRPDTTRIYDLQTHFRSTVPDAVTLPQYFKQHGYHSQGLGKIYHSPKLNDKESWSVPHWDPDDTKYNGVPAWDAPDVADNALPDGKTADRAVKVLNQVKDRPFFLAVGFRKPHLPFVAPKRYFELYPPESVTLATNPFPPKDVPRLAMTDSGELRKYSDIPQTGPVSDETARQLRRAYYASTSYTDAQVGKVIGGLEQLGLREKTVIVLWGDHGWQLGEHALWCKHTNFEIATRAPLIFSIPGQIRIGAHTDALAEFVDVYPTLCDACGLAVPGKLEGMSLMPVIKDPARPWKSAAFSQYPRENTMGHSMRTDRYRYTEWQTTDGKAVAVELYDHQADPDENVNIAGLPENEPLVGNMAKRLAAGWQAARPQ